MLLLYLFASVTTAAYYMGDTLDYSSSIVAHLEGRDFMFWEFGHVLWRPLGLAVFRVSSPITHWCVGPDAQTRATLVLITLSWLGGLLSVLSLHGILTRICRKKWPVIVTMVGFVFAQTFLNYFHAGISYISGLSLVLVSMYLLVSRSAENEPTWQTGLLAGAALAGGILVWLPYVLAAPATIASPMFFGGWDKRRFLLSLRAALFSGIFCGVVYLAVMAHIGIHNVTDLHAWLDKTSRGGGTLEGGTSRMIFGFARSFINMGNDGMLFKRYLIHDAFNPVSVFDLVRLSLWKLLTFYLFLFVILLSLVSSPAGRRVLALSIVNGLPVIAFAIYWQGGDPERYLPLYPLFFIAIAWSLDNERVKRFFKYLLIAFIMVMLITNTVAMARPRLDQKQETSAARIRPLVPLLKPNSWIFTANWHDDLVNFSRSFPFNPINQNRDIRVGALITPTEPEVAHWQQDFSERAQSIWEKGGEVWISKRLLSPRPRADWNWVEGDDPRVSWNDLYRYSSQLELGKAAGGDDGFVLLLPSERNRSYMQEAGKK